MLLYNDPKKSKRESEKIRKVYQAIAFEIDDWQPLFVLDSCLQDSFYWTGNEMHEQGDRFIFDKLRADIYSIVVLEIF